MTTASRGRYATKLLGRQRLVVVTASYPPEALGPHLRELYEKLGEALPASGGQPLALYETGEGRELRVSLGYPRPTSLRRLPEACEEVFLPASVALCGFYRGPHTGLGEAWHDLLREASHRDLLPTEACREAYHLIPEPGGTWEVELQQPLLSP